MTDKTEDQRRKIRAEINWLEASLDGASNRIVIETITGKIADLKKEFDKLKVTKKVKKGEKKK